MSDQKKTPAKGAKAEAGKAAASSKTKSIPPKAPAAAAAPAKASAPKAPASKRAGGTAKAAAAPAASATAPTAPAPVPSAERKEHGFRRKIIGVIVGDKMAKTVVVEVIRKAMHPMYKKYVRVRNRYKAHDENNVYKVGDRVEIMEHRPISRHKRWLVTRLVSRPVEA